MSYDQRNGMGMNTSYNPDAPTEDNDRGRSASERPAEWNAQPQGFSPDMPTIDGDTKTYVPESRKSREKMRRMTFAPDAPTVDGDDELPAQQSAAAPVRSAAMMSGKTGGAGTPFVPMGQSGNGGGFAPSASTPFKPMNSGGTARPMPQAGGSAQRQTSAAPGTGQPAANRRPSAPVRQQPVYTQQPQTAQARQAAASPVQRTAPVQPQVAPVPPVQEEKVQPDHRSLTLKEMVSVEERRYNSEVQQYAENISAWKKRLWIPVAMVLGIALLALLGGAFAGAVGVVFVLLISAAVIGILAATGKLRGFLKPKKPKKQLPQMDTPEMTSVYTVKLRLKSTNLPKPVEITIRKEEQLLGCDSALCLQPLPYKGISHRHCTIISKYQHGHTTYFVRDEGSKNGTRLNDRKLDPGIDYPLQIGDLITMAGRYQFKVLSDAY